MKSLKANYKTIIANYFGGMGYYSFYTACALWLGFIVNRLQHFIVSGGTRQVTDATTAVSSTPLTTSGFEHYALVIVSYVLILAILIGILALPYYIGKFSRIGVNKLLFMTGLSDTISHVSKLKRYVNGIFVVVIILTSYDFSGTAASNIYSLVLVSLCVLSIGWFFAQKCLADIWNIKTEKLF